MIKSAKHSDGYANLGQPDIGVGACARYLFLTFPLSTGDTTFAIVFPLCYLSLLLSFSVVISPFCSLPLAAISLLSSSLFLCNQHEYFLTAFRPT
jgi:hypothetical protein